MRYPVVPRIIGTVWAMSCLGAGGLVAQPRAKNMELVGHNDLQGRWSYQPVPHRYGERWILFVGHHAGEAANSLSGTTERNGMSILDVTDPKVPVFLHHEPPSGQEANGTQHIQVCDGSALPNAEGGRVYVLRTNGQLSQEILDVTDPARPTFVTTIFTTGFTEDGRRETHKNWWDCETGIGYLLSTVEGWRVPRVLQAYDLSDPRRPRHIRDFALDGMQPGGKGDFSDAIGLHQPVVVGDRIYIGYGSGSNGVLQILDRDKFLKGDPGAEHRFAPTAENLLYPQIARLDMPTFWGAHTVKPIYDIEILDYGDNRDNRVRDFLVIPSESGPARCQETRHAVFFVDVTQEEKPFPVSSFQVPEEPGDFCNQGGRFGPHSIHDSFNPAFLKKVVLVAYFNAGVRAVDIRDPFLPKEIGYFIPQVTDATEPTCVTIDGIEECKVAIQTNNVEIDDRGYIYLLDRRGTGLHIVALTGAAHDLVGLPR
ncbi:MAG TPA: hypothetical protein VLK65_11905 [Vicinamibacteria bacterium]|nr:hypothetical protein [Vicinamibacteria bacterium]